MMCDNIFFACIEFLLFLYDESYKDFLMAYEYIFAIYCQQNCVLKELSTPFLFRLEEFLIFLMVIQQVVLQIVL